MKNYKNKTKHTLLPMSSDNFSEMDFKITLCAYFLRLGSVCGMQPQLHVAAFQNMLYQGFLNQMSFTSQLCLKVTNDLTQKFVLNDCSSKAQ